MTSTRRSFVRSSLLAAPVIGISGLTQPRRAYNPPPPDRKLRVGIIGSGLRGMSHIDLLLRRPDCEVVGIADPDAGMLAATKAIFDRHGVNTPAIYDRGPYDYLRLLDTEQPDAAIIATPWEWHGEQAVAAMRAGAYTGLEVSGAMSINECWDLVQTHEATGTPLYFLENVCFRRDVMAIGRMVREGLFGELIHLECGYQHDLRGVKFNDGKSPYGSGVEFGDKGYSEAKWRTWHSLHRNGDLYPTHGIGPVSDWLQLGRDTRMETLVSMSSKSRGLQAYILHHEQGGPDHPNAALDFKLGDKVTTLIRCSGGETITLHHDTNLPRPYSLGFRVQGTKGLWMDVNKSLYLEGQSPEHGWEGAGTWLTQYDHPVWQQHEKEAAGAGHGGMDWFLLDDFVAAASTGRPPRYDVYDAAAWMAITPLSETSIAQGGMPQVFPDFTKNRKAADK